MVCRVTLRLNFRKPGSVKGYRYHDDAINESSHYPNLNYITLRILSAQSPHEIAKKSDFLVTRAGQERHDFSYSQLAMAAHTSDEYSSGRFQELKL